MGDIAAEFAKAEIVPNILPEPPQQMLNLVFDGIQVKPGMEISPRNLKNAPRMNLKVDPDSQFTLIMIDPDNLSRKNPSVAEWLHWLTRDSIKALFFDRPVPGKIENFPAKLKKIHPKMKNITQAFMKIVPRPRIITPSQTPVIELSDQMDTNVDFAAEKFRCLRRNQCDANG